MMKQLAGIIVVLGTLGLSGCVTTTQGTFSRTQSPSWTTIELRKGISYERAWDTTFEVLMKNFDINVAMREEGYLRTGWMHSWSGTYQPHYRVRVTLKYSHDRSKLQFRAQAQSLYGNIWNEGVDARLVSTLKTDLMGTIGRTTR